MHLYYIYFSKIIEYENKNDRSTTAIEVLLITFNCNF